MNFKHINGFLYLKKRGYDGVFFKKFSIVGLRSKTFIDKVIKC